MSSTLFDHIFITNWFKFYSFFLSRIQQHETINRMHTMNSGQWAIKCGWKIEMRLSLMHKWKWAIFFFIKAVAPISWIRILGASLSLPSILLSHWWAIFVFYFHRVFVCWCFHCAVFCLRLCLFVLCTPLIIIALDCPIEEELDFTSFSALLIILWNFQFFNLCLCCCGCCFCCTTSKSMCSFLLHSHFSFFRLSLADLSVCVILIFISMLQFIQSLNRRRRKKKQGKKSERKISHFNIDIAPVDVSIIKHEIPM